MRVFGWWITRRIDLRNRAMFAKVRCSWCEAHGFACGGDVHDIARQAIKDAGDI